MNRHANGFAHDIGYKLRIGPDFIERLGMPGIFIRYLVKFPYPKANTVNTRSPVQTCLAVNGGHV